MSSSLLTDLRSAAAGGATAVRVVTRLTPGGGQHDKVFPPTYAEGAYAVENRWVAGADGIGREVRTVLLDSVQSQANRFEQALKTPWEAGDIEIPMLCVDIPGIGRITALDAPHRAADAIFRDSLVGGVAFRDSEPGRAFVSAKPSNAAPLLGVCPTALVFGQWDSTAGAGTQGAKFQRILVSEMVGYEAVPGKRTSSRIDPLQISKVELAYAAASPNEFWTPDEAKAKRDEKGKPIKLKPSEINHGNVTPTIEDKGGFTIGWAEQITVLSFPALRRLRFPANGTASAERDLAGRVVVAALALHTIMLAREEGYDLRSRCLLVPESTKSEWLGTVASDVRTVPLDPALTASTLKEAIAAARGAGLSWNAAPIVMQPSQKLLDLVQKSRE